MRNGICFFFFPDLIILMLKAQQNMITELCVMTKITQQLQKTGTDLRVVYSGASRGEINSAWFFFCSCLSATWNKDKEKRLSAERRLYCDHLTSKVISDGCH